jgi:FkbM family methyltransferase
MSNNESIVNARKLFSDIISLCVFDARVKAGEDVKREAFPETLEFTGLDEAAKTRLLRYTEEIRNSPREKFIYGAGAGCRSVIERESARMLGVSAWSGIIDNNATGERYGLPIVTFNEFSMKHKGAFVLNSVGQPAGSAIHKQCMDAGIDCVSLFEFDMSWNQYFDLPKELGLVGKGEVFIHAGCYNGDTQKSYINWFGDTYAKMITFEPSTEQFAVSKEKLKGLRDVEIVQAGLSDKSGVVRFDLDIPGRSFISETGSEEINVVALDEFMQGQRITFIALDIEGEELAALRGAEQIIRTQKPKLAISAYHKPEDIWELPELIQSYNPEYKFYMRHYHLLDMAETVMYAL